jgi:hypothetical protein
LVLWVVLCLTEPEIVRALLSRDDLYATHDDLLSLLPEPLRPRGISGPLPSSDLPLLIDAANLIQLVVLPGRD